MQLLHVNVLESCNVCPVLWPLQGGFLWFHSQLYAVMHSTQDWCFKSEHSACLLSKHMVHNWHICSWLSSVCEHLIISVLPGLNWTTAQKIQKLNISAWNQPCCPQPYLSEVLTVIAGPMGGSALREHHSIRMFRSKGILNKLWHRSPSFSVMQVIDLHCYMCIAHHRQCNLGICTQNNNPFTTSISSTAGNNVMCLVSQGITETRW